MSEANLSRRRILCSLLSAWPVVAFAQQKADLQASGMPDVEEGLRQPPPQPYTTIAPAVSGDEKTVRLFFQFSCPHCRAAHAQLAKWGATLPAPFEFRQTPTVVSDEASILGAMCYYAMRRIAPERLDTFVMGVYAQIHERRQSPGNAAIFAQAAQDVGVSRDRFVAALRSKELGEVLKAAAVLPNRYQLRTTPAVAVAGHYVVTPEITDGVNERFYRLANAVVSKYMIDMGWVR